MRRYLTIAVGLALGVVLSAAGQPTHAEGTAQLADYVAAQLDGQQVQPVGYEYQAADYDDGGLVQASCQSCRPNAGASTDAMPMGELYSDGAYGCTDGSCGYGGCDTCYDWWPGDDQLFCGLGGLSCCGRFCFSADYLYVRSNISQATAYLYQTTNGATATDEWHNFDFQHESSYRLSGAYGLGGCGEELRFTFTRFNSYANETIPYSANVFVPFDVDPPPGGQTLANADVDLKTYDLELTKTIPLGGAAVCGGGCGGGYGGDCGDVRDGSCGCGCCCPTWDITWSGGLRFADADWRRGFVAYDSDHEIDSQAQTVMNFEGGGVRVGLEGRRYLGSAGIFSLFARGDLSLLLGNLDIRTEVRQTEIPTDTVNIQHYHTRNVIPVTDIEAGITAQVSCHTQLSAGYLFSGWHDLGMRDQELCSDTLLCTGYDDADILAFDGLFIRLEACF